MKVLAKFKHVYWDSLGRVFPHNDPPHRPERMFTLDQKDRNLHWMKQRKSLSPIVGLLGDIFNDMHTHVEIDRLFAYADAPI